MPNSHDPNLPRAKSLDIGPRHPRARSAPADWRHELRAAFDARLALKRRSPRTAKAYRHWIRRFLAFHDWRHPHTMGQQDVTAFRSDPTTRQHVAASTQNQALAALLFLFGELMDVELPLKDAYLGALARMSMGLPWSAPGRTGLIVCESSRSPGRGVRLQSRGEQKADGFRRSAGGAMRRAKSVGPAKRVVEGEGRLQRQLHTSAERL